MQAKACGEGPTGPGQINLEIETLYTPRNISAAGETDPFFVVPSRPPAGDGKGASPPLDLLLAHGLIRPKPQPDPTPSDEQMRQQAQQASRLRLAPR